MASSLHKQAMKSKFASHQRILDMNLAPLLSKKSLFIANNSHPSQAQIQTYLTWVNTILKKRPGLKLVENLQTDLSNGVYIKYIIEIISGETVLRNMNLNPINKQDYKENMIRIFKFMLKNSIKMNPISPDEIISGNLRSIIRLLLALAAHYMPSNVLLSSTLKYSKNLDFQNTLKCSGSSNDITNDKEKSMNDTNQDLTSESSIIVNKIPKTFSESNIQQYNQKDIELEIVNHDDRSDILVDVQNVKEILLNLQTLLKENNIDQIEEHKSDFHEAKESKIQELESECENLRNELSKIKAELGALNDKFSDKELIISEIQNKNLNLDLNNHKLIKEKQQLNAKIFELNNQNKKLKHQLAESNETISLLDKENYLLKQIKHNKSNKENMRHDKLINLDEAKKIAKQITQMITKQVEIELENKLTRMNQRTNNYLAHLDLNNNSLKSPFSTELNELKRLSKLCNKYKEDSAINYSSNQPDHIIEQSISPVSYKSDRSDYYIYNSANIKNEVYEFGSCDLNSILSDSSFSHSST